MKIQALVIAVALAAGSGFAAAHNTKAKAGDAQVTTTKKTTVNKMSKKMSTSNRKHAAQHRDMRRGMEQGDMRRGMEHGDMRRSMEHRDMHRGTGMMGGSAAPETDLNDRDRQARMEEALANFRRRQS
jgi:hypothetical protein